MINVPHLESFIQTTCGLSCLACTNFVVPWRHSKSPKPFMTPQQLERDLRILSPMLHTPLYGLLGGEPTHHPQLIDLMKVIRASGITDRVEQWTHGLTLTKQKPEFWRNFDILVVSVYPDKHTEESLAWIVEKCKDEGVELSWRDEREMKNFRTILSEHPTGPEETYHKFNSCFFRQYCRSITDGYAFLCCCGPSIPVVLQGKPFGTDGLEIREDLTEGDLLAYLNRTEPLGACSICAGRDTAVPIAWREERDPEKWKVASGQSSGGQ